MKNVLFPSLFFLLFLACGETPANEVSTTSSPPIIKTPKTETPRLKEELQEVSINNQLKFDYDTTQWTELIYLDSSILIDLKYATTDNFVKEKMYDCARCFLRPDVAKAVVAAHHKLQDGGLGLKMFDCFRPRPIQQKLWNKVPNASYVTPPSKGSMHNRGAAVDLTIVDQNGRELEMGTAYDFFGKEAHQDYTNLPEQVLLNRRLLKSTMASVGLKHIRTEWWHYSYPAQEFKLSDMLWNCLE